MKKAILAALAMCGIATLASAGAAFGGDLDPAGTRYDIVAAVLEDPPALIDCPNVACPNYTARVPQNAPAGPYTCDTIGECPNEAGTAACAQDYVDDILDLANDMEILCALELIDYNLDCANCDQPGATNEEINECRNDRHAEWVSFINFQSATLAAYILLAGNDFFDCVESFCDSSNCP